MPTTAQVREADVRDMLEFVSGLASFDHPDEFRHGALPGLRELVPCEIATYNEVEFDAGRMFAADDPPGSMIPGAEEIFVRLGDQNPLIPRYQRTRDGRPYKWSDFVTRRELHATQLYVDAYRPMGVEYQMAFCLPAPAELIIGIALNRGRRDFSERDRTMLNLVRAPMITAYRTVERYAAVVSQLKAYERGLEQGGSGLIVLERRGGGYRPELVSPQAAAMLGANGRAGSLPAPVAAWLGDLAANGRPRAAMPLLVKLPDGGAATLRFLPGRTSREADVVLIESAPEPLSFATLRAAGLTERQAEVLRLVAFGRQDKEIAAALRVSPRTVHKHLQNVYDKLGATSRTQAVLAAWAIERGRATRGVEAPS
jgi:DNA-binding CsgD family transcriptional regulator